MSSASKAASPFARPLLTLFNLGTAVGLTDGELLQRFTSGQGDSAEMAFSVLVERHGAMVLRVCRSVTGNRSEAEDAFQSTFLILARKARTVRVADTLAPWLYGVARKVSARALASTQRRRRFIERFAEWSRGSAQQPSSDDSATLIREELARLPQRYQAAVRLCDLDGFTQEEAAQLLKLPLGTIKSRIFRGRSKLREALERKGFTASWLCLVSPGVSSITLSPQLANLAVRAALCEGQGKLAAGALISSTVIALTEGSMQAMFMTKVKVAVCVVIGAAVVAGGTLARTGTGVVFGAFQQEPSTKSSGSSTPKAELSVPGEDSPSKTESTQLVSQVDIIRKLQDYVNAFADNKRRAASEVDKAIEECLKSTRQGLLAGDDAAEFNKKLEGLTQEKENLIAAIRELEGVVRLGRLAIPSVTVGQARQAMYPTGPPPVPPDRIPLPPPRSTPIDPDLEHRINIEKTHVAAKNGALNRAKAQEEQARALIANNERLTKRIPGSVSAEEQQKAEAELHIAMAGIEIAVAELQESEIELERLYQIDKEQQPGQPATPKSDQADRALKLEERMTMIETKIDGILQRLKSAMPSSAEPFKP